SHAHALLLQSSSKAINWRWPLPTVPSVLNDGHMMLSQPATMLAWLNEEYSSPTLPVFGTPNALHSSILSNSRPLRHLYDAFGDAPKETT
ncbi:unnamed protein product, partial [Aphanomyces euteiches]